MISERDVSAAIGSTAYGSDGASVGTVETFYTDDRTGATTWVAVSSGLLGTRRALAPAEEATFADGRLQLTVPADAVSSAPRLGGQHLSPEDEAALRGHYAGAAAAGHDGVTDEVTGHDVDLGTGGRHAADDEAERPAHGDDLERRPGVDDGSMVRSEEQLRVDTERVVARRVRVVKYVVTEEVQVTVPVRREEIRIEELSLDAPDAEDQVLVTEGAALGGTGTTGAVSSGLPGEIVLHAERPVVTVEVVPVERVRLRTEVVTEQEQVSGTVQREQVVVDQESALHRG
ncbi:DUF2382 domain-containing protein [Blastococcus sp. SYSU D01042]